MLAASNALPRLVLLLLIASLPASGSLSGPIATKVGALALQQQQLPGEAPRKTGAVEGVVHAADGRPVIGATAMLRNLASGEVRKAMTTAEGIFRLVDVPPGRYELSVTGAGYEAFVEASVTISAGDLLTRQVVLAASAGAAPTTPPGGEQLPPSTPAATGTESNAPGYADAKQNPNLKTGAQTNAAPPTFPPDGEVFQPEPNRWRVTMPDWNRYGTGGEHPYVRGSEWDPFDKNKWKGDVPVIGQQIFFNFTAISDTLFDGRRLPVPSDVSTARPGEPGFFGKGEQIFLDQLFIFSFDLFHGDAAFRPVDWRIRITPAVSMNYLAVRELGVVAPDVRAGTTRLDGHLGFQEMFGELKLHDIGPNFDFISVRAGIQEFNADFRGFLFVDEQPGVRFFGNLGSNRWQYNLAYFNLLEKNTNSGLNTWERRKQQVIIANLYRQDFLFQGYTAQVSISYNDDQGGIHYDDNGFLVRPSPIGKVIFNNQIKTHNIHAAYLGWTGDGHIGRVNLTHAFYEALGTDSFNPLAGRPVTINAQMAAGEASIDKDWIRFKASLFYASGSADPTNGHARGFDAIEDFPEFAGGIFSLWNREGIRLTGTNVGLTSPDSLLPSLRSDKDEGQANFVNPGIFLANLGTDFDLTPKLRGFVNVNYLRFERTEPLELLLFQAPIHHSIGVDSSIGVRYRPPLTENIQITAGAATLVPGQGLRDIYTGKMMFSLFSDIKFQF